MKKVVVISGGSDGLGKRIAEQLAVEYSVVILSTDEKKLKQTAQAVGCDFSVCDVSDTKSVERAVQNIKTKYGGIDCLINNAGIWIEGRLEVNDLEKIRRVIEVNTLGTIFLTKAAIPLMKERKGLIINVISQAGLRAKVERTVYAASKWAITGFTKSLQLELAEYGIRVTGFYPDKMNTALFEKAGNKKDMANALDTKDAAKTIAFLLASPGDVLFPEIGIKNINN